MVARNGQPRPTNAKSVRAHSAKFAFLARFHDVLGFEFRLAPQARVGCARDGFDRVAARLVAYTQIRRLRARSSRAAELELRMRAPLQASGMRHSHFGVLVRRVINPRAWEVVDIQSCCRPRHENERQNRRQLRSTPDESELRKIISRCIRTCKHEMTLLASR